MLPSSKIDLKTTKTGNIFLYSTVIQEMTKYLEETDIIDYSNKEIQKLATNLATDCKTDIEIAKNCFEYVRDNNKYTWKA